LGITTLSDHVQVVSTVTRVDVAGDAHHNGIAVGDRVIYIDMFDVVDLATYYSNLTAPPFSFETLIQKVMSGNKGSIVRLGVVRDGSPIVLYKPLTRDIRSAPVEGA